MIPPGQTCKADAMASIADLDRRFYADVVNEHVVFDRMIASYLRRDAVVLDAGAGRGFVFGVRAFF